MHGNGDAHAYVSLFVLICRTGGTCRSACCARTDSRNPPRHRRRAEQDMVPVRRQHAQCSSNITSLYHSCSKGFACAASTAAALICIQQPGHKCALHLRQKRSYLTVCRCIYLSVQVGLLCKQMDLHTVSEAVHLQLRRGKWGCWNSLWLQRRLTALACSSVLTAVPPARDVAGAPWTQSWAVTACHTLLPRTPGRQQPPERRHFACGCALM